MPRRRTTDQATIKDVALLAKTSATTASRALAGHPHVREDVRLRVLAAAETLHYLPNTKAQALRAHRTDLQLGPDYRTRQRAEFESKARIGRYVAEHWVRDGDVVVLDSGTTVREVALALKTSPIVYTYSIPLLEILGQQDVTVFCAPGRYNPMDACNVGDFTETFFRKLRVPRAILSCHKFDVLAGPCNLNESMDHIRRAIVEAADEVIMVVDHTKFTDAQLKGYLAIRDIRTVITDFVPDHFRTLLDHGVELVEGDRVAEEQLVE